MTQTTSPLIYEQHPLSANYPAMRPDDFVALRSDIAAHGMHNVITLYEGMILDGYHRYLACLSSSIQPRFQTLPESVDPVAFVESQNDRRRHLSASQRAIAIVANREWAKSGRPENSAPVQSIATTKQMAAIANVCPRMIEHAKAAHTAGLGDAVRDGEMSVKKAAAIATPRHPSISNPAPYDNTPTATDPAYPEGAKGNKNVLVEILEAEITRLTLDNEAMGKIFEEDDRLKAAMDENAKLRAIIVVLESRLNGIISEKAEAIKAAKKWKAIACKLERPAKVSASSPAQKVKVVDSGTLV